MTAAVPDLDQMMCDVEAEAARRRAGREYPHDLEARIEAELARQAPGSSGRVPLEGLVTAVEAAVTSVAGVISAVEVTLVAEASTAEAFTAAVSVAALASVRLDWASA